MATCMVISLRYQLVDLHPTIISADFHKMNNKYFGLAQMAGGTSLKEKCACMPVEWCCIGFSNVTTADAVIDGSHHDLWLQSEQMSCLNKYEQKPLVEDIDFNDLNKRSMNNQSGPHGYCSSREDDDDDDNDDDAEDIPFLNSYFSPSEMSTPSSSKSRAYRMRLGVRRGLKSVSRKLRKERFEKKCQVTNAITLHESASEYPSQELSQSHFLYPLKEEASKSSVNEDESIDASTRLV